MSDLTLDALVRDTRHAVRRLVRDWRFTVAAVVILGLGLGANTAIFSLINATLIRQQSFADPDRLVDLDRGRRRGARHQDGIIDPTPQLFYRSFAQWDLPPTTVLARTSLDAAGLLGAMQRELRGVDVTLPIISAKTMATYLEESLVALGLCLAGIGLYAVVAFAVSRRSREIGIRMALGARSQEVVWTVVREVASSSVWARVRASR